MFTHEWGSLRACVYFQQRRHWAQFRSKEQRVGPEAIHKGVQQTHPSCRVTRSNRLRESPSTVMSCSGKQGWDTIPTLPLGSRTLNLVRRVPRSSSRFPALLGLIHTTPEMTSEPGPYGARAACRRSRRFSLPGSPGCRRHTCTCLHPPGWH